MGTVAASPPVPSAGGYPSLYRPRNVRATPLYQLLESYYEDVKALWEDRFEKKYGFWRGFVDSVVARYLRLRNGRCRLRKTSMRSLWFRAVANPELQTKRDLPVLRRQACGRVWCFP